jgi:hypothetical protein
MEAGVLRGAGAILLFALSAIGALARAGSTARTLVEAGSFPQLIEETDLLASNSY